MQDFIVSLASEPSKSFRCTKAANALDIDVGKKLTHELKVSADITTPFSIGLIVGASGSGKSTLARQIYGSGFETPKLDLSKPVIDQFPADWSYDQCAQALSGMGLTAVPCWIRPAGTLSNGQRARAEAALQLSSQSTVAKPVVIDEWTSVVDRTVAKAMSTSLSKHARRTGNPVVLLSCHYDIIEWLNPDWIIDCNTQSFQDRRALRCERKEKLKFEIRPCGRDSWRAFSRYHYLSERLPGGLTEVFGLYHGADQIGFQCFANYTPIRGGQAVIMHSNRTVIHPDYVGFGLGIKLIDATSAYMAGRGFDVRAKFSSVPVFKAFRNNPNWRPDAAGFKTKMEVGGSMLRKTGFRVDIMTYVFSWCGPTDPTAALAAGKKAASAPPAPPAASEGKSPAAPAPAPVVSDAGPSAATRKGRQTKGRRSPA